MLPLRVISVRAKKKGVLVMATEHIKQRDTEETQGIVMTCYSCGGANLSFDSCEKDGSNSASVFYTMQCRDCGCKAAVSEDWTTKDGGVPNEFKGMVLGIIDLGE